MLKILQYNITRLIRERATLFLLVLFPALMVYLLGHLLENMDMADRTIDPLQVQVVTQTQDPYGKAAIDLFTQSLKDNDRLVLEPADSLSMAQEAFAAENADAAVVFKEPLAIEIFQGKDSIKNRAVQMIFSSFAHRAAAIRAVVEKSPQLLMETPTAPGQELVAKREFKHNRTMLDYYAVTMLVMTLFLGGSMGGSAFIYEGRKNGTLRRMMASPKNRASIYVQSVLGSLPQTVLQIGVIMSFSFLAFGARYADSFTSNLLLVAMFLMVGMSVAALFTLIGIFIKTNPSYIIMPLMWTMMFVSGTYSKEIYIEGVTTRMPMWLVQNAAFDLTVFGRGEKSVQVICVSAAIFLIATAAGALLFRKKEIV